MSAQEIAEKAAREINEKGVSFHNVTGMAAIIARHIEPLVRGRDELREMLKRTTFLCSRHKYPFGTSPTGEPPEPICPWCERQLNDQLAEACRRIMPPLVNPETGIWKEVHAALAAYDKQKKEHE